MGDKMKLIVGLGNPGARYEITKHNVGFIVADLVAELLGIDFKRSKHEAMVAETRYQGKKLMIAKPQTYMNLSGRAVASLVNWYKLGIGDLIIVYDDLDLEIGKLRIRSQGSAGGQKGIASIIQALGTDNLLRIRLGIGRPTSGWNSADYVLSPFTEEQWTVMAEVLPLAAKAALGLTHDDLDKVMNQYNQ